MARDQAYRLAEEKIKQARRDGATKLDLYGMELTEVPEAIGELLLPLCGAEVYAKTPPSQRPQAAIARLRTMRDGLHEKAGLPRTLQETGKVQRHQLAEIAKLAIDDGTLIMNPRDVSYEDALAVLERAF